MNWSEGDVVAWWDDGRLSFGVVAGEEKRRLRMVPPAGREIRVPAGRLAFRIATGGPPPGRDETSVARAAAHAAEAERAAVARAATIDVALVWDLAVAERGPVGLDALAAIALDADDGAARAALVLAFLEDGIRFVRKGDHWEPREREAVAALLHEREVAGRRETRRAEALRWLALAAGGTAEGAPDDNDALRRYLDALRELAVHDLDVSEAARVVAEEALRASGLRFDRPFEGAFRLLRAFGQFDHDDVNLQIERYRFRTTFPDEVVEAAERAAARGFERAGREDRSDRFVVTIDAASTREVDDGLSVEPRAGGGWRLGIHIADPGAFVELDDEVDREARERGATLYFPDSKATMLPPILSEDAASLSVGVDRPAMSFDVEVGPDGTVGDVRVTRTVVRVAARLGYDEADAVLAAPGDGSLDARLRHLSEVAEALERGRLTAGALLLVAPDVDVRVGPDGAIALERLDPRSAARRIVTEAMVAAGTAAARIALAAGVPLIFRRQTGPDRAGELAGRVIDDPVGIRRARMALRRGEIGLSPGRHFALGVDAYAQVTSPLRRYQDLANQRQLAAIADGRAAPHDETSLRAIAAGAERAEIDGRRAERAAVRYWMLRYLERSASRAVDATVVEPGPRAVVSLDETRIEEPVAGLDAAAAGDRVRLRVTRIVPRADVLRLRPADGLDEPAGPIPGD